MITVKVHDSYRKVVGICDLDLIGKKVEEGKRQLDLRANFYQDRDLPYNEAVKLIKRLAVEDATFNIVGEESIKAAIEAGIIKERNVDQINGVPFTMTFL